MAHPAFQLWTVHQSTSQATVLFYVPRKTRSADLHVRITSDSITAGVRDQPPVINASLWSEVHPHLSSWQIERPPRKHRKPARARRQPPQPSPPLPGGEDAGPGTASPRLSSGPPSTAYSIIGDSAPGSHGVRSISDADSGSESEPDAAPGMDSSGYISQPEDGSQSRRRQLSRFDPASTRSFSSRSQIQDAGGLPAGTPAGLRSTSRYSSSRQSNPGSDVDAQQGTEDGIASSVASLPARLRPAAAPTGPCHRLQADASSASASRLASRSASTASFSSLGSVGYDIDQIGGPMREQRELAGSTGSLSHSQDSFLSTGMVGSSDGDATRLTAQPQPILGDQMLAAEPTPLAERTADDLIPASYSTVVPGRPPVLQSQSHDSNESQSITGSGSGGSGSGSGLRSGPPSNVSGSLLLPSAPDASATASAPASTSAASVSSGISTASLAGARLVTIYLEKVQPGIWPVLVSGPAPLPYEEVEKWAAAAHSSAPEARLPLLSEDHARNSLRVALQEALDESRASATSANPGNLPSGRRRDSEAGRSDDSDTVLGLRKDIATQDNSSSRGEAADVEGNSERQRKAYERLLSAKYNLDATSLVLLGLQTRAQLGHRAGGVDDPFHYFSRAWRAGLSPIATCRLVEDYLPLVKLRAHSSDDVLDSDADDSKSAPDLTATASGGAQATGEEGPGPREKDASSGVPMDRRQHSSDTLRSPRPSSRAGDESPMADKARSTAGAAAATTTNTSEAQRDALISLLGGSNALGRLYLSYARLHLEVSIEKWISPLAFPAEAGQLHGPYTSSAAVMGAASPVALSSGAGGGTSPGVVFHGVTVSPSGHISAGAGLGLGTGQASGLGWSRSGGEAAQIWDGLTAESVRHRGAFGPVAFSTSARSPSSVHSGRSGSVSPLPRQGAVFHGSSQLHSTEQTSVLLFASHERERVLRRHPTPLAYMQAAVRLDPTLATRVASPPGGASAHHHPPARPHILLPGEHELQAWRMPMSIEEDEWTEAHELEVERRAAIRNEARYRAALTGEAVPGSADALWDDASVAGTATPTSSSVPSSEANFGGGGGGSSSSTRPGGSDTVSQYGRGGNTPSGGRELGGGSGGARRSGATGRRKSSRRHGRSSMRRNPSTLPLISEEGMINIVSGAAVLSVVVAGSVAVMGWWRRVGGTGGV